MRKRIKPLTLVRESLRIWASEGPTEPAYTMTSNHQYTCTHANTCFTCPQHQSVAEAGVNGGEP